MNKQILATILLIAFISVVSADYLVYENKPPCYQDNADCVFIPDEECISCGQRQDPCLPETSYYFELNSCSFHKYEDGLAFAYIEQVGSEIHYYLLRNRVCAKPEDQEPFRKDRIGYCLKDDDSYLVSVVEELPKPEEGESLYFNATYTDKECSRFETLQVTRHYRNTGRIDCVDNGTTMIVYERSYQESASGYTPYKPGPYREYSIDKCIPAEHVGLGEAYTIHQCAQSGSVKSILSILSLVICTLALII